MPRTPTSQPRKRARPAPVAKAPEAIPERPEEPRTSAGTDLQMVNAFKEEIGPEGVARRGVTPSQWRVGILAWVSNVSFEKKVWADVYLVDLAGGVSHAQSLPLDFKEPAGGNGDFFSADAVVPPSKSRKRVGEVAALQYRLYYQVDTTIFTDGVLHSHPVAAPGAASIS